MGEWKKTTCSLCVSGCGLEVEVENNKIIRVRGDYSHPRSKGHACRKGRNIARYLDTKDRIRYPMKRVGNEFVRISWDQAIDEVCTKLRQIVDTYGPRTVAASNMGHLIGQIQAFLAAGFMNMLGTRWHYCNLAAEVTGEYWASGTMLGSQDYILDADESSEEGEMLVASGWNGYVTNNIPTGKRVISKFARDPNRILVVIDPRKSETARMADIHLAIRPGTDTVLWRAIDALILQEEWYNQAYIDEHVSDFEKILSWFKGVDVREYVKFCGLDYDDVYNFAHLLATKKTCLHSDLGVICGRNSTLTTYLSYIALVLTGNLLTPGGVVYCGRVLPRVTHTDNRDPDNWKTLATGYPTLSATHPPAVLAEEIDNDGPEHLRALIVGYHNPMRSIVDSPALDKAFKKLDLLVSLDCQFTETSSYCHYLLPSQNSYEIWESSGMLVAHPYILGDLRQPVIKPEEDTMYFGDIFLRMTEHMGFLPEFPKELYDAAQGSRLDYQKVLLDYLEKNPEMMMLWPQIVAKTLGPVMGSSSKAIYWGMLVFADDMTKDAFERFGYKRGPNQAEEVFQEIIQHPAGVNVGKVEYDDLFKYLLTPDKKIHLFAPEMDEWVYDITPEKEEKAMTHPEFPFLLFAGYHCESNANFQMRGDEWLRARPFQQVLTINPEDAERLGFEEGQSVKVTTKVGQAEVPIRITTEIRKGCVQIPHGIGLRYNGVEKGVNINILTKNTDRDPFAGTPYLRYVPCNVEPVRKEVLAQ